MAINEIWEKLAEYGDGAFVGCGSLVSQIVTITKEKPQSFLEKIKDGISVCCPDSVHQLDEEVD